MQTNFQNMGGPALKEKVVNGVTLHWSEPEQMFMFPMPEKAKLKLLFHEQTGTFLPVNKDDNILMREREATAPDGTKLHERIIYRDPQDITALTLEQHKNLIAARRLQWQSETWETIVQMRPLLVLGLVGSAAAFFWNLICAIPAAATGVAVQAGLALAEITYYAVWAVSLIAAGLALKFIAPLLFRSSGSSYETATGEYPSAGNGSQGGDVIINVQQGTGQFGSQSEAQKIVNTRSF